MSQLEQKLEQEVKYEINKQGCGLARNEKGTSKRGKCSMTGIRAILNYNNQSQSINLLMSLFEQADESFWLGSLNLK